MKSFLLLLLLSSSLTAALAQSSVTSVSYNKTNQPALMLELPYDEEVSEGFIISNLKKTGYDAETKGKLFWKQNLRLPDEISPLTVHSLLTIDYPTIHHRRPIPYSLLTIDY